jgi:RNase H-fold protein (predicted Holliday junction resolvase)
MTVEEMGLHAGITRQTMYDYLKRWLELDLISKTSYISQGKVIVGYKLNGSTLESSFEKAVQKITNHLQNSMKYVRELQKLIKNEKISASQQKKQENVDIA